MKKVIRRMTNAFVAAGWRTWIKSINAEKDEVRVQKLLKKTIGKVKNGALSAAMKSWLNYTQEHAKAQRVMGMIVKRIVKGGLWKGFGKWTEVVKYYTRRSKQQDEERKVLNRISCKMKNLQYSASFNKWISYTASLRDKEDVATSFIKTMGQSEQHRDRLELTRRFAYWKQRVIEYSLDITAKHARAMTRFEDSMNKLMNNTVQAYFHRWHLESVNARLSLDKFDNIVSDKKQLMDKFTDSPELLRNMINGDTLGAAFGMDPNLFAKALLENKNMVCPECQSATTDEFMNKNGFEYPLEWLACARKYTRRCDDMLPATAISLISDVRCSR